MTPVNVWNLISSRSLSLGLEHRVTPLLHWIRAQTTSQAKAIEALVSVDLSDSTLQARQDLNDKITPPTPSLDSRPGAVPATSIANNSFASSDQASHWR